jgi:hypothetical protein
MGEYANNKFEVVTVSSEGGLLILGDTNITQTLLKNLKPLHCFLQRIVLDAAINEGEKLFFGVRHRSEGDLDRWLSKYQRRPVVVQGFQS